MLTIQRNSAWISLVLVFLFISTGLLFSYSCGKKDALTRIKKSGILRVITRNNAHCYYIYRDQPMGFEYDLAREFSRYLGVKLRIITPKWGELKQLLYQGKGDLIAASMTITESRKRDLGFSIPYMQVQQMVIVHRNNYKIKGIKDLSGKVVHVRKGTSYEERLRELQSEGINLTLKLYDDIPTEELIRMVAQKEIEITVADSNIAMLNRRYYPDVKIAFPIEEPQHLGWAVKKGEKALLNKINAFFRKIKKDGTYSNIYHKYYANVDIFDYMDLKKYHRRLKTRLPKYKKIIQETAQKYEFDWRLIAAMIYQESHFDPEAESFTGVKGLMQITSRTAQDLGINDRTDPKQSIMAGVRYLRKLYDYFDEAQNPDRLLIALASYNVGKGHIIDAQRIAKEKGMNPNSWSALKETLPLLRYRAYYKKSKYGYCRGTEPIRYVDRILIYYDILKREAIS